MASGGGGGRTAGGMKKARFEIIPLIDIMFFLLASFMLVSLSMLKLAGLKNITLPGAKTAVNENKPDFLTLSVTEDGRFGIDKDEVSGAELVPRLQARFNSDKAIGKETRLYVNCDGDTPFPIIANALDAVRTAGITKISFAILAGGGGQGKDVAPAEAQPPANP